jgi:hypothetical protein
MLELWGHTFWNCDRVSRRSVMRVGSMALGGVTLANLSGGNQLPFPTRDDHRTQPSSN